MRVKSQLRMLNLQLASRSEVIACSCMSMRVCLLCRWEVLEQVLQLIEGCESLEDYKRLVHEGGYKLNVLPGGVLKPWKGVDPGIVDGSVTVEASHDLLTAVPHGPVLNSTVAFMSDILTSHGD